MRFTATASAVMAFAASALAQTEGFNPINTPAEDAVLPAGSTFEVTWDVPDEYRDDSVSISLIGGDNPKTLVPVTDIAEGVDNGLGSFQWVIDESLGDAATYGIVIKLEKNPEIMQYSKPFHIKNGEDNNKDSGKPTKTVTTGHGIKTITLSSTSSTPTPSTTYSTPTSTPSSSTPTPTPSSTTISTPSPIPSSTSTELVPEPTEDEPEEDDGEEDTDGGDEEDAGAHLVAGHAALFGGLVMAYLAL